MPNQVRDPTSDASFTGTSTETATTRWTFVDDYPSQVDTNILTHGTTTPGEGLFGFTAFAVPAGSVNIVVTVNIYAYKNSGAGNSFATRIRAGSTPANADGSAITTLGNGSGAIALFSQSFSLNPKTGAAWTVADVNGAATNGLNAFGIVASDANPSISITSIQLEVDYDPNILTASVGDQVTLTEVVTPRVVHKPQAIDALTLTDGVTAQLWQYVWAGATNLLEQPHLADTVTLSDTPTVLIPFSAILAIPVADLVTVSDGTTVLIPIEGVLQIPSADQVTVQDAAIAFETPLNILTGETLTAADDASLQLITMITLTVDDTITLSDVASVGTEQWSGHIQLFVQPHAGDGLTLTDVQTVGNDRYAEIAWIEMEIPASSTEIDVPFGILQSGQISIQLKYRGNTNKVRAILATNVCGHAGTFIVNDNGIEHLVIIPHGTVDEEIVLDEEVTMGNGVACNFKHEKVSQ